MGCDPIVYHFMVWAPFRNRAVYNVACVRGSCLVPWQKAGGQGSPGTMAAILCDITVGYRLCLGDADDSITFILPEYADLCLDHGMPVVVIGQTTLESISALF